jgi:hypothetical protein
MIDKMWQKSTQFGLLLPTTPSQQSHMLLQHLVIPKQRCQNQHHTNAFRQIGTKSKSVTVTKHLAQPIYINNLC